MEAASPSAKDPRQAERIVHLIQTNNPQTKRPGSESLAFSVVYVLHREINLAGSFDPASSAASSAIRVFTLPVGQTVMCPFQKRNGSDDRRRGRNLAASQQIAKRLVDVFQDLGRAAADLKLRDRER